MSIFGGNVYEKSKTIELALKEDALRLTKYETISISLEKSLEMFDYPLLRLINGCLTVCTTTVTRFDLKVINRE